MTPKSYQLDIAFKVNPMVIIGALFLTLGMTLKGIFSLDDFSIIGESFFCSIKCVRFIKKRLTRSIVFLIFQKINR